MPETYTRKIQAIVNLAQTTKKALELTTPVTLEKVIKGVNRMGGTFADVAMVDGQYENQISVRSTGRTNFVVYERPERDTTDYDRTKSILNAVYDALAIGFGNPAKWNDNSEYVMSYARPDFEHEQMNASQFIAEVMMPEAKIQEWSSKSVEDLADHFSVPVETMQNRLELSKMFRSVA